MALSEHRRAAPSSIGAAVITVSDTRTPETDRSGALIRDLLQGAGHRVESHRILPDDPGRVRESLAELSGAPGVEAVLLTGGTGISARDRTYEAVCDLLDRRLDGFGEIFRALSYEEIGPAAMLSRAVAGLIRTTPVFSMPGSEGAVRLAMERLILPELGHLVGEARKGAPHE